jgi:DNA-damage-inducible protein J
MTAGSKTHTVPADPLDDDLSYDEWLKAEIEESINDPRPSIASDEVERHFAAKRAALKKRIQGS